MPFVRVQVPILRLPAAKCGRVDFMLPALIRPLHSRLAPLPYSHSLLFRNPALVAALPFRLRETPVPNWDGLEGGNIKYAFNRNACSPFSP